MAQKPLLSMMDMTIFDRFRRCTLGTGWHGWEISTVTFTPSSLHFEHYQAFNDYEGEILVNLGSIYCDLGQYERALT
ncbi:MAG: tetratricopeptide repeat-containing protein [Moorea sp. SIO2B7]|nr:tetratricopeptide repeat-containing protein [Moorena sp. SIO2B7]